MVEMVCKTCGKRLKCQTERGELVTGHYLFNDETYCPECWEAIQKGCLSLNKAKAAFAA